MLIRRRIVLAGVLGVLALGLAACGKSSSATTAASSPAASSTPTATSVSHTKTKFALHAGLAFGAIYQWIYKPAKAGELTHPLQHKLTTVKAVAAGGFAYHQLKLALADAQADPTLSHLVAPITALQNKIKGVPSQVRSGGATSSVADGINSSIMSIKGQAASAGQSITNQVPATPSG